MNHEERSRSLRFLEFDLKLFGIFPLETVEALPLSQAGGGSWNRGMLPSNSRPARWGRLGASGLWCHCWWPGWLWC